VCFMVSHSSHLLMRDPCPGKPEAYTYAMAHINLYSTLLIGLGIEESELFGSTDLPEEVYLLLTHSALLCLS
jgi:hypothetical protein